jgi:hypothetical protein
MKSQSLGSQTIVKQSLETDVEYRKTPADRRRSSDASGI